MLIDTHCHLYLNQFDEDRAEVIRRAVDAGVSKMYLPNIDSTTIKSMYKLESAFPQNCFSMMGLHPCSVKENFQEELAIARKELEKRSFCAVGEIGLDFYWDKSFVDQQKEALEIQIQWAKEFKIPVVLHTRDSFEETYEIIEKYNDDSLSGVFHCFGGTAEQAQRVISLGGFYVGIGGVATFKKSGLDTTLKEVDINGIILETDAPYLAPVPYRGKRNESAYVPIIAQRVADIKNLSQDVVAKRTTKNAETLFGA